MKKQTQPIQQPGGPAQPKTPFFKRVTRPFATGGRFVGGLFGRFGRACTRVCGVAGVSNCGEIGRAAMAGALLLGIAGAGFGAQNGFRPYGLGNNAAGATMQVGWGENWWVYWALAGVAAGALVGAAFSYLSRKLWGDRGAARTVLAVGVVGGILAGAAWGNNVARERLVQLRAQHASAPVVSNNAGGYKFSVVNGGVRLSGTVGRDVNETMLAFMLLSGALVGILAARGILHSSSAARNRNNNDYQQPFQPPQQQY